MPMRIGLDYLLATTHAPGLGRYSRELVRALVRLPDGPELRLWEWGAMQRSVPIADLGLPAGISLRRVRLPHRLQPLAHRLGLGVERQLGELDWFHRVRPGQPALDRTPYSLPVVRLPRRDSAEGVALHAELQQANGVFVFCRDYAKRLQQHWEVPAERIAQVPVGCDHWARSLAPSSAETRTGFVALGALRAARRTVPLLRAWEAYRAAGHPGSLRLLGQTDLGDPELVAALERARDMGVQPTVPQEADMPQHLLRAHTLVHLADDEGSPVTPLEAARLGLHLVLEELPAFREAFPPEGPVQPTWLRRDPDPETIADALAKSAARPPRQPQEWPGDTWEACAQAHWEAWQGWAGRSP